MAAGASIPGWPGSAVSMVDARLPAPTLARMQGDAAAIAEAPNFWITRERLEALAAPQQGPGGSADAPTAVEAVAAHLLRHCLGGRLPPDWTGAEFWVQVYEPGAGLAFHFDKDEALLVAEGRMAHPALSSVMYLSGSCQPGARREGPTVVLAQLYDQAAGCPDPESPTACVLAFPLAGHFLAFDGRLGHGVLDSFATTQRMTLLINWWTHQPQAVREFTAADAQRLGLAAAPVASEGTAGSGDGSDGGASGRPGSQQEGTPGEGAGAAEGAQAAADGLAALRLGEPSAAADDGPQPQPQRLHQLSVPAEPGDTHLVDDLVAAAGLALTGPGAGSLVAIDHPGCALCPIDPQETAAAAAAAGEAPPELQVAAVFMHESLCGDEEEEQEGEEDGGGGEP